MHEGPESCLTGMTGRCPTILGVVRAVLFDYGGVILSSPFEAFSRYERERGLPEGFLRQVNATNPDTNAWARLERSELSLDEFATAFRNESAGLGHEVDGAAVLALLSGDIRPQMVEALKRCHDRLKTACLTNNFVAFDAVMDPDVARTSGAGTRAPAHVEVLEHFDVIVESSKVGVRKPDVRFFELACEMVEIEPHEAVFLDDLGVNLKPARAMGMHTIKVSDPDVAIDELASIVGFPLRQPLAGQGM